ncbi:hypothetical protein [Caballeronia glebae]|uniref:Uncharacterized protein n=1 Tax=Caballeronia glebae TaxID=1777143 RepID=A0A158DLQ6_9BURK|nr:hypothetical protein [Caballeronia glebae]SAK95571.1 hypothetical protein AWB82_06929 [Caballeronia glebae]
MPKPQRVTLVFYNEEVRQIQVCTVVRSEVQSVIERQISRGTAMNVPLGTEDAEPQITDDVLKQIGGLAVLSQGVANPELRSRFHFTTENPMKWDETPPAE